MVWMKDTVKPPKSHFVNNGEYILVISPTRAKPVVSTYPLNSKVINIRPSKKWKTRDGVCNTTSPFSN